MASINELKHEIRVLGIEFDSFKGSLSHLMKRFLHIQEQLSLLEQGQRTDNEPEKATKSVPLYDRLTCTQKYLLCNHIKEKLGQTAELWTYADHIEFGELWGKFMNGEIELPENIWNH